MWRWMCMDRRWLMYLAASHRLGGRKRRSPGSVCEPWQPLSTRTICSGTPRLHPSRRRML